MGQIKYEELSNKGAPSVLTRSRRRVPPVARTRLPHRAVRTTSGTHLIVLLNGKN